MSVSINCKTIVWTTRALCDQSTVSGKMLLVLSPWRSDTDSAKTLHTLQSQENTRKTVRHNGHPFPIPLTVSSHAKQKQAGRTAPMLRHHVEPVGRLSTFRSQVTFRTLTFTCLLWNLYLYSRSYILQSCNFQSRIFSAPVVKTLLRYIEHQVCEWDVWSTETQSGYCIN